MRLLILTCVFFAAIPASAAESVVLKNGFRMHVDRHETDSDGKIHLFVNGGSIEMNATEIERFEAEAPAPPAAAPATPAPITPATVAAPSLDGVVRAAGAKYGLDPDFIRSIIHAESAGNARAVSPKGASGLMQLMPGTAKTLGVDNVFDPAANVEGGTAYIRQLLDRYDHDVVRALAAYNAGPGKVEIYGGMPPYRDTQAYVSRVITLFNKEKLKAPAVTTEQ
jgi:soluble lytic murein transglycosylase-like protein